MDDDEYDIDPIDCATLADIERIERDSWAFRPLDHILPPIKRRKVDLEVKEPNIRNPLCSVINEDDCSMQRIDELLSLNENLRTAKKSLQDELYARVGEVSIVRQNMTKQAEEHQKVIFQLQESKRAIENEMRQRQTEMQKEMDRLRTELLFNQQEMRTNVRNEELRSEAKNVGRSVEVAHTVIPTGSHASSNFIQHLLQLRTPVIGKTLRYTLQVILDANNGNESSESKASVKILKKVIQISKSSTPESFESSASSFCCEIFNALNPPSLEVTEFRLCLLHLLTLCIEHSKTCGRVLLNQDESSVFCNMFRLLAKSDRNQDMRICCIFLHIVELILESYQVNDGKLSDMKNSMLLFNLILNSLMLNTPQALLAATVLQLIINQKAFPGWIQKIPDTDDFTYVLLDKLTNRLIFFIKNELCVLSESLLQSRLLQMIPKIISSQPCAASEIFSKSASIIAPRLTEFLTNAVEVATYGPLGHLGETRVDDGVFGKNSMDSMKAEALRPDFLQLNNILHSLNVLHVLADECSRRDPGFPLIAYMDGQSREHIAIKCIFIDTVGPLAFYDEDFALIALPVCSQESEEYEKQMSILRAIIASAQKLLEAVLSPEEVNEMYDFYAPVAPVRIK